MPVPVADELFRMGEMLDLDFLNVILAVHREHEVKEASLVVSPPYLLRLVGAHHYCVFFSLDHSRSQSVELDQECRVA